MISARLLPFAHIVGHRVQVDRVEQKEAGQAEQVGTGHAQGGHPDPGGDQARAEAHVQQNQVGRQGLRKKGSEGG